MVEYNPQLLLEAPEENVSEIQMFEVPCDALISNRPSKRKEGQSFKMYWKTRRNANLALKKRLREGKDATLAVDLQTMDVVTLREQIVRDRESLANIILEPKKSTFKKKTRKGLKLAQGR